MVPMEVCLRDGCERPVWARGWCSTHYSSERKIRKTAEKRAAIGPLTCTKCGSSYVPIHYTGHNARCAKCREPIAPSELTCVTCGKLYVPERYSGRNKFCSRKCKDQERINDGRSSAATRRWLLLNKYGLTTEKYDEIFERQGGACAICGRSAPVGRAARVGARWLNVDHCHDTGEVRGLLCMECNTGIGKLGDSVEMLHRAIAYLTK